MVKFFKKSRQESLGESNFRRYLIYALGEIILIVIGIFIAIQLNSLKEDRKLDKKRTELIGRLNEQLTINLKQINEGLEDLRIQKQAVDTLMHFIGQTEQPIDVLFIDNLMLSVIEDHHLGLDLNTLEEALDNGEISTLKNSHQRTALYNLKKLVERVEERERIANYDNNNFLIPYLYKKVNWRNISSISQGYKNRFGISKLSPSDYTSLFQDREFENLLNSRVYYAGEMVGNYQNLKAFLEFVKKELEK